VVTRNGANTCHPFFIVWYDKIYYGVK